MEAVVSALAVTPVKGTRLHLVDRIQLQPGGVRENRRFFVIDADDRMRNGKQLGELSALVADYSDAERTLRMTFPDGSLVEDEVRLGEMVNTRFFSARAPARLLEGPWSRALSEFLGQPLRLVEAEEGRGAVDRGEFGAASLISRASVAALARAAGEGAVDARRFRMLIEVDGVDAHAEDRWVGRRVGVGEAEILVQGHVGRCLVTSRHPETGAIDLPTLDIIRSYRGDADTTEPLPFGIFGEVTRSGPVRVDDQVHVGDIHASGSFHVRAVAR